MNWRRRNPDPERVDMTNLFDSGPMPMSTGLPPYGSIETCPKCTCHEATERYRSGGPFDPVFGEYIENQCEDCGFVWRVRCADYSNGDQP